MSVKTYTKSIYLMDFLDVCYNMYQIYLSYFLGGCLLKHMQNLSILLVFWMSVKTYTESIYLMGFLDVC